MSWRSASCFRVASQPTKIATSRANNPFADMSRHYVALVCRTESRGQAGLEGIEIGALDKRTSWSADASDSLVYGRTYGQINKAIIRFPTPGKSE